MLWLVLLKCWFSFVVGGISVWLGFVKLRLVVIGGCFGCCFLYCVLMWCWFCWYWISVCFLVCYLWLVGCYVFVYGSWLLVCWGMVMVVNWGIGRWLFVFCFFYGFCVLWFVWRFCWVWWSWLVLSNGVGFSLIVG